MGVTYKLRDDVVHFIISERQSNPLFSCRQLAESASQKFGLRLSKSSVHDVLKESGIVTPRGRKPKDKFKIPQEKKKQIQTSLSQVKLLAPLVEKELSSPNQGGASFPNQGSVSSPNQGSVSSPNQGSVSSPNAFVGDPEIAQTMDSRLKHSGMTEEVKTTEPEAHQSNKMEISPEYEGAGKIFLKAARWDLGIFSEENIKETDWKYYLTYSKGVRIVLENNKEIFIDFQLPLERCIRAVADGLVNNITPFIAYKISDGELFKSCMEAQFGTKIKNISIVDYKDHIVLQFVNIVELKREYLIKNIEFVENKEKDALKRSKSLFFSQVIDNNSLIEKSLNLKGFDSINKAEYVVTLLIKDTYENKDALLESCERLNKMYLRDEQGRLVSVKIQS